MPWRASPPGQLPGMEKVPASQTQPWVDAGFGLGYVVAEKSIKNKSSESAPRAVAVGRQSAGERPSLKCCFWYRFHIARSRYESWWLRGWFSLKNEANPKQLWSRPFGHFTWLSFCLSVHPGVVFQHRLRVGRESGCAANAHRRLVLCAWPGASHSPPPSRAGRVLDGGQPEIIGANIQNPRWKRHVGFRLSASLHPE